MTLRVSNQNSHPIEDACEELLRWSSEYFMKFVHTAIIMEANNSENKEMQLSKYIEIFHCCNKRFLKFPCYALKVGIGWHNVSITKVSRIP